MRCIKLMFKSNLALCALAHWCQSVRHIGGVCNFFGEVFGLAWRAREGKEKKILYGFRLDRVPAPPPAGPGRTAFPTVDHFFLLLSELKTRGLLNNMQDQRSSELRWPFKHVQLNHH